MVTTLYVDKAHDLVPMDAWCPIGSMHAKISLYVAAFFEH